MIDIDNFKQCNDNYGHLVGDKVLKRIAEILSIKTRKVDILARYGGEEFVIIAPYTDKKGASALAARLVSLVYKENFKVDEFNTIKVTISIGVATYKEDADSWEELIQKADDALYQAKKMGKNRVCIFGINRNKI